MNRQIAVLCSLFFTLSLSAVELPGMQQVPPAQMQGTLLLLPELAGGSIQTPGPGWEWHCTQNGKGKGYLLMNPATGARFMLAMVDNLGDLNDERTARFLAGMKSSFERSGMKLITDNRIPSITSQHGEVRRFQFKMLANGNTLFISGNIISIGDMAVVLSNYTSDGVEPQEIQGLLDSLKYAPRKKSNPADLALFETIAFFVIGGVFCLLGLLINALSGRQRINGPALSIVAIIIAMAFFISYTLSHAKDPEMSSYLCGQVVGAAFLPLLIFGYYAYRGQKKRSSEN